MDVMPCRNCHEVSFGMVDFAVIHGQVNERDGDRARSMGDSTDARACLSKCSSVTLCGDTNCMPEEHMVGQRPDLVHRRRGGSGSQGRGTGARYARHSLPPGHQGQALEQTRANSGQLRA